MQPERLAIEQWPIERLIPYARNPRRNDHVVARMAAAIAEFGFRLPVLAHSDGTLVDGHLRLKAAQSLGLTEVPVVLADDLSEAQIKAFRLLVNRSASWADWDDELLGLELLDLQALDYDLGLTGFDDTELQRLLDLAADGSASAGADDDAVPELPTEPVSRPGDLWVLGHHRLLCGDATAADDVTRLLGGTRPNLLVSDPPYGVAYDPAWRNDAGVSATARTGTVRNDDRADWRDAWALFPGDVAYVWHAGIHARTVAESLDACGFTIRSQLIWVKNRFVLSRGHYHWQHEPCFYAVRGGGRSCWQGARDQSTVWPIATNADDDAATVHGTQKPVECMLRPMLNNSARGDAVYEPFAGSGTTVIAAEKSGRRCFGMEIDPRYCDVIVTRWQSFTGRKAALDDGGRTFDAVAGERLPKAA
ncbi:MAG: DNA methyltransferase [Defluviicoccus sp.]